MDILAGITSSATIRGKVAAKLSLRRGQGFHGMLGGTGSKNKRGDDVFDSNSSHMIVDLGILEVSDEVRYTRASIELEVS